MGGLRTAGAVVTQNAKLMVLHADQFKVLRSRVYSLVHLVVMPAESGFFEADCTPTIMLSMDLFHDMHLWSIC